VVGGVCADTVIVGSVLVIIAVAPALNSSNMNDIPTVKVHNEFLLILILIYLKIYIRCTALNMQLIVHS